AAIREHQARRAEATITLTSVENPLAYGIVIVDTETGRIERFLEKPTWSEVFSDTINTGIYILEPPALERVPPETNMDFSRDLFPEMLRQGAALYGHIARGYWRDIGNLDEYRRAHEDILSGRVHIQPRGQLRKVANGEACGERGAALGTEAKLGGRVIVGRNVRVGRAA